MSKEEAYKSWEFIFSDFDGWVVLECHIPKQEYGYWVYPTLYPKIDCTNDLKTHSRGYSKNQQSSAYSHVLSGDKHCIKSSWEKSKYGIPLYFSRIYYGNPKGEENYYEFNQLITHPLGLHWSHKKNSYCVVNKQGEEIEKIKIIKHKEIGLILIRRKTLDKLLCLGEWILLRYCNFRYISTKIDDIKETSQQVKSKELNPKIKNKKPDPDPDNESRVWGYYIDRPITPKEQLFSVEDTD